MFQLCNDMGRVSARVGTHPNGGFWAMQGNCSLTGWTLGCLSDDKCLFIVASTAVECDLMGLQSDHSSGTSFGGTLEGQQIVD